MFPEAMTDLRQEILSGRSVEQCAAEIAADYGVNPALLTRKFLESYRSEEALRATVAATSATIVIPQKVEAEVARQCKRHGVPVECATVRRFRGASYTYICSIPGSTARPYLAVSHEDARCYRLPAR